MDAVSFLILIATLIISLIVCWALLRPFFEPANALAVGVNGLKDDQQLHKETLLDELEELELEFKGGLIDQLRYAENRQQLLRELAPYYALDTERAVDPGSRHTD